MSNRPKVIRAPESRVRQNLLSLKLAILQAVMEGKEVKSFGEIRLACEASLLDVVLEYGVIDTDQFLAAFLKRNKDFKPFLEAEPLIYDQACQNVSAWCIELST